MTQTYRILDCTYRYLRAAAEYQQHDAATRRHFTRYHQNLAGNIGASTRTLEIEVIMVIAELHHEDVPNLDLALALEGTVRQGQSFRIALSKILERYALENPWRHLIVGFWPAKWTLGLAYILLGFVFNAGAGRSRRTVGYAVAFLLVGPVCALLHMVILEWREGWVSAYVLGQGQRWI